MLNLNRMLGMALLNAVLINRDIQSRSVNHVVFLSMQAVTDSGLPTQRVGG